MKEGEKKTPSERAIDREMSETIEMMKPNRQKKNEFLHNVNRIKRGGWRRARESKPKIVQNANKGSKFINTEMTKSIPLE